MLEVLLVMTDRHRTVMSRERHRVRTAHAAAPKSVHQNLLKTAPPRLDSAYFISHVLMMCFSVVVVVVAIAIATAKSLGNYEKLEKSGEKT